MIHEQRESFKEYYASVFSFGSSLESPEKALEKFQGLYIGNRKNSQEEMAAYIRSFEDVDWSNVFQVLDGADEIAEERELRKKDNLLKHYVD